MKKIILGLILSIALTLTLTGCQQYTEEDRKIIENTAYMELFPYLEKKYDMDTNKIQIENQAADKKVNLTLSFPIISMELTDQVTFDLKYNDKEFTVSIDTKDSNNNRDDYQNEEIKEDILKTVKHENADILLFGKKGKEKLYHSKYENNLNRLFSKENELTRCYIFDEYTKKPDIQYKNLELYILDTKNYNQFNGFLLAYGEQTIFEKLLDFDKAYIYQNEKEIEYNKEKLPKLGEFYYFIKEGKDIEYEMNSQATNNNIVLSKTDNIYTITELTNTYKVTVKPHSEIYFYVTEQELQNNPNYQYDGNTYFIISDNENFSTIKAKSQSGYYSARVVNDTNKNKTYTIYVEQHTKQQD